jgi:hypothetical protein
LRLSRLHSLRSDHITIDDIAETSRRVKAEKLKAKQWGFSSEKANFCR